MDRTAVVRKPRKETCWLWWRDRDGGDGQAQPGLASWPGQGRAQTTAKYFVLCESVVRSITRSPYNVKYPDQGTQ